MGTPGGGLAGGFPGGAAGSKAAKSIAGGMQDGQSGKDAAVDYAKREGARKATEAAGLGTPDVVGVKNKAAAEGKGAVGQTMAVAQEVGVDAAAKGIAAATGGVVPTFISKPVLNLAVKVGVKVTAFILVFAIILLAGVGVAIINNSVQPVPIGANFIRSDVQAAIPKEYLDAYYEAAQATGVPWTVIAALGATATDHGRTSPYDMQDYGQLYDRDSNRPDILPDFSSVRVSAATSAGNWNLDGVGAGGNVGILIAAATKWINYPYASGGGDLNGPTRGTENDRARTRVGFDCTKYTRYIYHQIGIELPAYSGDLGRDQRPRRVDSIDNLLPGDLVVWVPPKYGVKGHAAMYIGNGKIIHAHGGDTSGTVSVSDLREYIPVSGLPQYPVFLRYLPDDEILADIAAANGGTTTAPAPTATEPGTASPGPSTAASAPTTEPASPSGAPTGATTTITVAQSGNMTAKGSPYTCDQSTGRCGVDPPIGTGAGEGQGPMLIWPDALLANPGMNPQDINQAALFVAKEAAGIRDELVSTGKYPDWSTNPQMADKLWEDVVSQLGGVVAIGGEDNCDTGEIDQSGDIGEVIRSVWACSLSDASKLKVVTGVRSIHPPVFQVATITEARQLLLHEALQVSWQYSKWGSVACDASAEYTGVFPVSDAMMKKYGPKGGDRCNPVNNIQAAAKAVIAGEKKPLSQRSARLGPYQPMFGGWALMAPAFGDDLVTVSKSGPASTPDQPGLSPVARLSSSGLGLALPYTPSPAVSSGGMPLAKQAVQISILYGGTVYGDDRWQTIDVETIATTITGGPSFTGGPLDPKSCTVDTSAKSSGLVSVLQAAGFTGEKLHIAWAISMRETGDTADPKSFNGDRGTGDESYGLFQINMIDGLGVERQQKFTQYVDGYTTRESLFDPLVNARAAWYLSDHGTNWKQWDIDENGYLANSTSAKGQEWHRIHGEEFRKRYAKYPCTAGVTIVETSTRATAAAGQTSKPASSGGLAGKVILLDPGHQRGNSNPKFAEQMAQEHFNGVGTKICNTTGTATDSDYPESTMNWEVALKLKGMLEAAGATVILTRDRESVDAWGPCVNKRGEMANTNNVDVMLSIHGNGDTNKRIYGFFIIRPADTPGVTDDVFEADRTLGNAVIKGMTAAGAPPTNDPAYRGSTLVDKNTSSLNVSNRPTITVELGNMKNPDDAKRMRTESGQTQYAQWLYAGLVEYFK